MDSQKQGVCFVFLLAVDAFVQCADEGAVLLVISTGFHANFKAIFRKLKASICQKHVKNTDNNLLKYTEISNISTRMPTKMPAENTHLITYLQTLQTHSHTLAVLEDYSHSHTLRRICSVPQSVTKPVFIFLVIYPVSVSCLFSDMLFANRLKCACLQTRPGFVS